jgi:amidophosphoribosyltransferase
MIESVDNYLIKKKTNEILNNTDISKEKIIKVLSEKARIEKIAIKDVKLRTFITEDSSRDDLVEHVYDITYGVIKKTDTLIIIDDSIVRGTTLKKSILKMLDRLGPKKIIVVSSAPQIRYPDCYGIDMANLESLIAFKALLSLLKETNQYSLIESTYKKCKKQELLADSEITNYVKDLYALFSAEEISNMITSLLSTDVTSAEVKIIFQSIENLHKACPNNLGDWYFTGNYPTNGGNRVVNNAFINFYEGNKKRAY